MHDSIKQLLMENGEYVPFETELTRLFALQRKMDIAFRLLDGHASAAIGREESLSGVETKMSNAVHDIVGDIIKTLIELTNIPYYNVAGSLRKQLQPYKDNLLAILEPQFPDSSAPLEPPVLIAQAAFAAIKPSNPNEVGPALTIGALQRYILEHASEIEYAIASLQDDGLGDLEDHPF